MLEWRWNHCYWWNLIWQKKIILNKTRYFLLISKFFSTYFDVDLINFSIHALGNWSLLSSLNLVSFISPNNPATSSLCHSISKLCTITWNSTNFSETRENFPFYSSSYSRQFSECMDPDLKLRNINKERRREK